MEELIMLFLEQIVEAIYFSVFLIEVKNIKEKRFLFIGIMVFEYLMLKHFIHFSVYFQLSYTFMTYITLKVLYKEKAQITDIFLFGFASLVLIGISVLSYVIVYYTVRQYFIALLLNRILLIIFTQFCKKRMAKSYKKFCSLWNRHNIPHTIKSLTLRNISVITFNLMFWLINIGMAFSFVLNS